MTYVQTRFPPCGRDRAHIGLVKGESVMAASDGLPLRVRLRAVQGDALFVPLRAPLRVPPVSEPLRVVAPLELCDVRPGMRCVDGQWFYSARWL